MFTREGIKTATISTLLLIIVFTSFTLYRAEYIDPVQDARYSEVNGWEE